MNQSLSSHDRPRWQWDVFGDGYTMVVTTPLDYSWARRMWFTVIFGSRWTRLP